LNLLKSLLTTLEVRYNVLLLGPTEQRIAWLGKSAENCTAVHPLGASTNLGGNEYSQRPDRKQCCLILQSVTVSHFANSCIGVSPDLLQHKSLC